MQSLARASVVALSCVSLACGLAEDEDAPQVRRPSAPSGLVATVSSASSIALSWVDNSTSETQYTVEAKTDVSEWAVRTTLPKDATSFTDTGLAASTTYSYRVKAGNSAGDSAYSATASATTSGSGVVELAAPTNVKVTGVSATSLEVSWTDTSTGETGFEVDRATSSSGPFAKVATTAADATSHIDSGLATAPPTTTGFARSRRRPRLDTRR